MTGFGESHEGWCIRGGGCFRCAIPRLRCVDVTFAGEVEGLFSGGILLACSMVSFCGLCIGQLLCFFLLWCFGCFVVGHFVAFRVVYFLFCFGGHDERRPLVVLDCVEVQPSCVGVREVVGFCEGIGHWLFCAFKCFDILCWWSRKKILLD